MTQVQTVLSSTRTHQEPPAPTCARSHMHPRACALLTADIYGAGDSERVVGNWLKAKPRDSLVIATKVAGPTGAWCANVCRPPLGPCCDAGVWGYHTDHYHRVHAWLGVWQICALLLKGPTHWRGAPAPRPELGSIERPMKTHTHACAPRPQPAAKGPVTASHHVRGGGQSGTAADALH